MKQIKFNKKDHVYKVNGVVYKSVTTKIAEFFPHFDTKKIAKQLASYPHNKLNKRGVRYWTKLWKLQQEYGSQIHNLLDMYIKSNCEYKDEYSDKDEYTTACTWIDSKLKEYGEPVLYSEYILINDKHKLAGTVDLLIEHNGEGTERVYDLIDYKITKEISKENKYDKSINSLGFPNSNYWKYCLQLNMYAWMLKEQGYKINKLILLHLKDDQFIEYEIPCMFDKVGEILGGTHE